jgi:hypothetical protein
MKLNENFTSLTLNLATYSAHPKVNAYLEFVKSGQLLERYPNTDSKKAVRFVIVFEERPSASVSERIKALKAFLIAEKFDVDLKYFDRSKGDVVDLAF